MASHIDPYQFFQIVPNPDGTITRLRQVPHASPVSDPNLSIPVLSKDITINQSNNTFLRIFLPRRALGDFLPTTNNKLPLIVFFHGGAFILLSAASTIFHDFCANMASDLNAVVISVEYRLAPQHRLPAAYDDAMEALLLIKAQPEDWLRLHADLSNCYLMGSSAGANITYYAGLRAAADVDQLGSLKIRGLILVQPYFGGTKRAESELRLANDPFLPPFASDLSWELSLPVGVDRDHQYCNPTAGDGPRQLDKIRRLGWRVLVTGCEGDPLVDRQKELVRVMEQTGVQVVCHFSEGGSHGIQNREPEKAKQLYGEVKNFILSLST